MSFVPDDFPVPKTFDGEGFRLEPLTAAHNVQDYAAWHNSIQHIKATPGFETRNWPMEDFSLEQNLADLVAHEDEFARRVGFTYSVLSSVTGEVIGCLYLIPPKREGFDVDVRSWVCSEHAELDKPLYDAVLKWIATEWPFKSVDYAKR
ncbi:hypothetical protein BP5796_11557 [Coleophoma crateriformis]|uniref:N-acetyltransferase domain-containing protein n=1 Tax=Coleophoma crateriformis TaxID=565419 RepID=A0A3D8QIN8_9HELO|nr:hypothetical protein BP5796_11557 [Coleophoma crateriformis]